MTGAHGLVGWGRAGLRDSERITAMLMLSEDCGIHLWRPPGERRWTYQDGRHRARALMDAGVRRDPETLVT